LLLDPLQVNYLLVPTNYKVWYDFMFFQSLYIIFRVCFFTKQNKKKLAT
jgi:hypothetical protein